MTESDEYYRIPGYPDRVSGATVLARMLDGLGFRFYWATEGLRPEDYAFRPAPDTMSIGELIQHVWGLMNWISIGFFAKPYARPGEREAQRRQALEIISGLRSNLVNLGDDDLETLEVEGKPFWNAVNGPVSDALTHTGQINSFRRLAGNPVKPANVFLGEPPKTGDG